MSRFEKGLRLFADIVAGLMGSVEFTSHKNSAPLWLVVAMAILGVITLALLALAGYAYFVYVW